MRLATLSLVLLAGLPVLAENSWSAALTYNSLGASQTKYTQTIGTSTGVLTFDPDVNSGAGVRLGYQFMELGSGGLEAIGAYRFRSKANVKVSNNVGGFTTFGLGREYGSLGVEWNWHKVVDWGFGLEARWSRLTDTDPGPTASLSMWRPWLSGNVGKTFGETSGLRPFIAMNMGIALTHTSAPDASQLFTTPGFQDLIRSLDAVAQVELQFGVRF